MRTIKHFALLMTLMASVSACGTLSGMKNIGKEPPLSPIVNPVQTRGYEPVSLPMPQPDTHVYQTNSLWQTGAKQFFRDQRASKVGDILTVEISIQDRASLGNSTTRSRSSSEEGGIDALFGLQSYAADVFAEGTDAASLVGFGSTSASKGNGDITRSETIELTVAAIITQILPNGNLVIQGRQEVRVNFEVRELLITGIVRPEDISNANTIDNEKIAEARISYGGRGQISKLQQPRYGQQIYEKIYPF